MSGKKKGHLGCQHLCDYAFAMLFAFTAIQNAPVDSFFQAWILHRFVSVAPMPNLPHGSNPWMVTFPYHVMGRQLSTSAKNEDTDAYMLAYEDVNHLVSVHWGRRRVTNPLEPHSHPIITLMSTLTG
jgi:hypothetical protein